MSEKTIREQFEEYVANRDAKESATRDKGLRQEEFVKRYGKLYNLQAYPLNSNLCAFLKEATKLVKPEKWLTAKLLFTDADVKEQDCTTSEWYKQDGPVPQWGRKSDSVRGGNERLYYMDFEDYTVSCPEVNLIQYKDLNGNTCCGGIRSEVLHVPYKYKGFLFFRRDLAIKNPNKEILQIMNLRCANLKEIMTGSQEYIELEYIEQLPDEWNPTKKPLYLFRDGNLYQSWNIYDDVDIQNLVFSQIKKING